MGYSTKKKAFLKDVRHEVEQLRLHATPEEKAKLNFKTFDYKEPTQCIYGQLAGKCDNNRAKELMDLSCIRVMDVTAKEGGTDAIDQVPITDDQFVINGKYDGQTWESWHGEDSWDFREYRYLSALEGYICSSDAKNAEVIAYIRGETNVLKL